MTRKTLFTEAERQALREASLPHAEIVALIQKAYGASTGEMVTTKTITEVAGVPLSKVTAMLKAAEKAGVVKSRVVSSRSRSGRPSGTSHRRKTWWVPREVRKKYGVGAFTEAAGKPLVLKRIDKTSWLDAENRWSVEAIKTKKGIVFRASDLYGAWKAGPFDNWQQIITALEKKTKRSVKPEGVTL